MSIAVFDFDYTLFDTALFVEELAKLMNFTVSEFRESCHKAFTEKGLYYNAYEHLKVLGKEDRKEKMNEIIKRGDEYIYPDARQVLKQFHQSAELILASKGDLNFQHEKIYNCEIKKYFNNIIVTKDKLNSLRFLKNATADLIFINDNAEEMVQFKEEFPQAEIILIESPYSQNIEHPFPTYHLNNI